MRKALLDDGGCHMRNICRDFLIMNLERIWCRNLLFHSAEHFFEEAEECCVFRRHRLSDIQSKDERF
ncbi:MAG: hypothetical protein HUJ74_00235 [Lachnospiraceae bacterium]|nr:hypothetical protein [Lachnospiraceae bacterium]